MMLVQQLKIPAALIAAMLGAWLLWTPAPAGQTKDPTDAAVHPAQAPKPKPVPEPAWKSDFRAIYGLKPGEHVKRVAPPYHASRTDYLKDRFRRDAGNIPFDEHFTVLRWRGAWAPGELAYHTLPVKPNEGISLSRVLDMTAKIPQARLRGLADLLNQPVTGDFVVRDDATPEQIVAQLQTILAKECGLAVVMRFHDVDEEVFVLSGRYESKPLPDRDKDQVEIYAEHLTDRETGGGGTGSFQRFLEHVEGHVKRTVVTDKIDNLPKRLSWHYNVRSPMLVDPTRGIDTHAEDTNPLRVLNNIAAQTGLKLAAETRKTRVLEVSRE